MAELTPVYRLEAANMSSWALGSRESESAMRPIWRKSPRSSRTAQCSRTISSSTRNACIASKENARPVGGMPKKLPRVPLAQHAEIQAIIAEPDPRQKLAMYAALGRKLIERVGPLLSVLFAGAKAGDPELAEFAATTARERLIGVSGLVGQLEAIGALRPGLGFDRARDIVWTLVGWEVYELLVIERGWSLDEWQAWVAESTAAFLLRDAGAND
jgi:hypothetical protein